MLRTIMRLLLGVVCLFILALAHVAVAEDSSVFKNPADISRAQQILTELGYLEPGGYTPGVLGRTTSKALAEYQSQHSLNSRGALDDDTYQMLLSHVADYPWATEPPAPRAAEPVPPPEPAQERSSTSGTHIAEAPPVPPPTPSTAEVKEAPHQAPPEAEHREMPATASNLPVLGLLGLALLAAGFLVLRARKA